MIAFLNFIVSLFLTATLQSFTIQGRITDQQNRAVQDMRVTLMTDAGATIQTVMTDTSGRYLFRGLEKGLYEIRVETGGTDFEPITRRIQLFSLSERGVQQETMDFLLKTKKEAVGNTVIPLFAQEIPEKARAQYKQALTLKGANKPAEALEALQRAVQIFPDYFEALETLGLLLSNTGQHEASLKPLTHALEVNPKSSTSHYYLGMSYLNLKQMEPAVANLKKAVTFNGASAQMNLSLGYALMLTRQFAEAEEPLKKAYQLDKAKSVDAQLYLASAYDKLGRFNDAANALEIFMKESPKANKDQLKIAIEKLRQKAKDAK